MERPIVYATVCSGIERIDKCIRGELTWEE